MSESLLNPNIFYVHPLTLEAIRPAQILVDSDGDIREIKEPSQPQRRESLTIEDIVNYYYESIGIHHKIYFALDCGGVRHLLVNCPLDTLLFAIDALIADFLSGDAVYDHAPRIIKAQAFLEEGNDRKGDVLDIARQYGNVPVAPKRVITLEQLGIE